MPARNGSHDGLHNAISTSRYKSQMDNLPPSGDYEDPKLPLKVATELKQAFHGRYRFTNIQKITEPVTTVLGFDLREQYDVFLKILHGVPARHGVQMRLEHEAQKLLGLGSRHLASLQEVRRADSDLYLVFKLVDGISLENRISQRRLQTRSALQLAESLFSALHELHRLDILHRDVKPANVLIPQGRECESAILVDLGPSSSTYSEALHHEEALVTSSYLSPEQAGSIDHDIGPPSDFYAAGAVLFHALAGRPPFLGETVGDVLFQHMTSPVPQLAALGMSVPRVLEELLQRLLRKDPRDRYQSAEAVLVDIRQISSALEQGQSEPEIVIGASDVRITLTEPAFVSRGEELRQMDDLLQQAKAGRGGLVLLEADSGSGKSRLLVEMAQRAARAGICVLQGKQASQTGQRPLQLLDGVVSGVSANTKINPQLIPYLKNQLGEDLPALIASLPRLASILNTIHQQDEGPEAFGEARSLRALATLLNALGNSEKTTLILLDDCQWADELTLKLFERWSDPGLKHGTSLRNVLIVLAFRTEEVPRGHQLRRMHCLEHLALQPLTGEDVQRIAESMAGPLPKMVLEAITNLADGSPFMASAVMRGLVESGKLIGDSKGWHVDSTGIERIQSSSQAAELLTQRLALLDTNTLELLSVGAILGKEFDISAASQLTGQSSSQVIAAVDKARRRCLVWVKPDQSVGVFVHDKIRTALLERMLASNRKKIHRKVAIYLLSRDEILESEVAFHFDAAGDSQRALPYALVAAQQARSQYAFEFAEQHYRIANRGIDSTDRPRQYQVAQELGDVLMLRGDYDNAAEMYERAAKYAEGSLKLAQIGGKLAKLAFSRGDMDRAVVDYERALRTLGMYIPHRRSTFILLLLWESILQVFHSYLPRLFIGRRRRLPDDAESLAQRLFSGLAHGSWYARSKTMTLWCHLKGMNLAESYLPTLELAHAYAEHAPVMTLLPLHRRAIRYAEKSLEICRLFNDTWGEGNSLHYYGVVLYAASHFEACVDKCREAVRLLERMGDYWQVHIARYQISASYYHLGRFDQAIEQARQNYESGLKLGDEQASGIIFDVWERAAFGEVAEQPLTRELERIRHDAQGQSQVLFAKAIFLIHKGKYSEAVNILQQANSVARSAGVKNAYTIPILAWLATALRCDAQKQNGLVTTDKKILLRRADTIARGAVRAARICQNDLPRVLREQAIIGAMRGVRESKVRKFLERSLQIAENLGEKYEYAETLLVKGQIGQEYGWPKSSEHIAKGQLLINQLHPTVSEDSGQEELVSELSTLSLADRFDTVLDSGRRVASGLTTNDIYQEICSAALRLLRGQHCLVLETVPDSNPQTFTRVAGNWEEDYDRELVIKAIETGCALTGTKDLRDGSDTPHGSQATSSRICVPIHVRDRAAAVLLVANQRVAGLFGENERRLADFIACLAGAALENAEGFQKLQNLNQTLEQRVADRTAAAESRARELKQSNEELERTAKELRQAEEELHVAMHEVESASRAKSQFLATMSHEIRTPMNGILGMTELALHTPMTAQQQNYLKTIKQSGDALLTLLNDVLDLSKVEAGRMELEQISFAMHDVVEGAVRLMAAAAAKKKLELFCRIAPTVPPRVMGDPNRLRQILVNLVGNAIKFTHQGEVFVEVEMTSQDEDLAQLTFSVQDTGIGIPADKQQSVFEAFRQSDSSTTREYGGTGLGLSITTTLTKLMGGSIRLESEEGQGSTFHLEIPFCLPSKGANREVPSRKLQDLCVLLVCRNPKSLRIYQELFENHGAKVQTALEPEAALQLLEQFEDTGAARRIAVLDAEGENKGMGRLVSRLQAGRPRPWHLVALVPAGQAEPKSLSQCSDCLAKPPTTSELLACISQSEPAHGDDKQSKPLADLTENAKPLKILLAEDSPVNQEVASGILEIAGHQVTTVDDGSQAVEAVTREWFDVVLMDIEMPTMDGLEATRTIRQSESGRVRGTPIIAMTAHAVSGFRAQCREVGMDGYISKPIEPAELFRTLDAIGAQSEMASA